MPLKIEGRYHLGTMQLTASTKLEFNIVRHNDRDFVDVRTWFANAYQEGQWTPTKKGIHFPLTKMLDFNTILLKVKTFDPQDLKPDVEAPDVD